MRGKDIASLYLAGERPEWRTEFFYEHAIIRNKEFIPASEALVRKDWKYFSWPDFHPFGKPPYATPNVEKLTAEGVRYTRFHVPQAVCSASRPHC